MEKARPCNERLRCGVLLHQGDGPYPFWVNIAFFNGSPHPFAMENPDEWWTDREVGYRFTASGLVLYIVDSRRSRDVEYIDYQAWDND